MAFYASDQEKVYMSTKDEPSSIDALIAKSLDAAKLLLVCIRSDNKELITQCVDNLSEEVQDILFPLRKDENNRVNTKHHELDRLRRDILPEACVRGDKDILQKLLSLGADPFLEGSKGTPLEICNKDRNMELIEVFAEIRPEVLYDITQLQSCLLVACHLGYEELVQFWINKIKIVLGDYLLDFTFEHDFVNEARAGKHDDIAKQVLLQLWAEDEVSKNTSSRSGSKAISAKWSRRKLPLIEPNWLHPNNPEEFLVSIDLSYNSLYNVDGDLIWGLPRLEDLNMTYCALRKIPEVKEDHDVLGLRLQTLDLSHNRLEDVPADLFMIPTLQKLHLQDNKIKCIQPVSAATQSKEKHESLDRSWRCESLENFNLANNALEEIPLGIQGAKSLNIITVTNCRLSTLPESWTCPLRVLDARNNKISSVKDMSKWRRSLKKLYLAKNDLRDFPVTICKLFVLDELDLSSNKIQKIPAVKEWKTYRLSILTLSDNQILCLNRELRGRLLKEQNPKKKDKLWRQATCSKTECPEWIQTLSGKDEAKCDIPRLLFTKLTALDLRNNRLQEFPESICDLQMLQILDISGNSYMTYLPRKMGLMSWLVSFKLDGVNITKPTEVAYILRQGRARASDIVKVQKEILLNYQEYRGIKVMFIGPRNSGKSKVCRYLGALMTNVRAQSQSPISSSRSSIRKESTDWDASEKTIVSVHNWKSKSRTGLVGAKQIDFTVWAVEGGEDMTVISQSLFTRNTIYVLVWDYNTVTETLPEIQKWMLNVKVAAPDCKIIGVGTYDDEARCRLGLKEHLNTDPQANTLKRLIPGVADILVDASNHRSDGIKSLYRQLLEFASKIPLLGRRVPKSYLEMKEKLSKELNYQSHTVQNCPRIVQEKDFRQMFKESEEHFSSGQELKEVVSFLKETGTLIHVSDHTYRLTNMYFLDPNWLCKVLLRPTRSRPADMIGTHPPQLDNMERMKRLCKGSGFSEGQFDEYIELLGRFEIAIPYTDDSFLLPGLLPTEGVFSESRDGQPEHFSYDLMRLYKMKLLPAGFFIRLISRIVADVRRGRHVESSSTHRVDAWRNGIVITRKSHHQVTVNRVEVRDGTYVCVSAKGHSIEDLSQGVALVSDHIEYLIKDWYSGLLSSSSAVESVQRLVPCPLCVRNVSPNQSPMQLTDVIDGCFQFQLTKLTEIAIAKKQKTVVCERTDDHIIQLQEIIPDLFLLDLGLAFFHEQDLKLDTDTSNSDNSLGKGSYGIVLGAVISGKRLAVKSLLKSYSNDNNSDEGEFTRSSSTTAAEHLAESVTEFFPNFRKEVATMSQLQHPCIVKIASVNILKLMFAMEFAPYGDLSNYLDNEVDIPDIDDEAHATPGTCKPTINGTALNRRLTSKIAYQILAAVDYLHKKGIIHTDLKTNNILVFSPNVQDLVNVKLADYGISQITSTGEAIHGRAGLHAFTAPEIISGGAFNEKADIFSTGLIFFHVTTGFPPGGNAISMETKLDVAKGDRPEFEFQEHTLHPNFKHLEITMTSCWRENPGDRPSAYDLLQSMKKPSYCCLKNYLEITNLGESGLVSEASKGKADTIFVWTTNKDNLGGVRREVGLENLELHNYPSREMHFTSAFNHKSILIVATRAKGMYVFNDISKKSEKSPLILERSTELNLMVTCLLYIPTTGQDTRDQGFLYAGLEDGRVAIYKRVGTTWKHLKFLTINDSGIWCSCMVHVFGDDTSPPQLLVACENNIKAVNTTNHAVKHEARHFSDISMESGAHNIAGMVCSSNSMCCFLSKSSRVYKLDKSSGNIVAVFECGTSSIKSGDNLLLEKPDAQHEESESTGIQSDITEAKSKENYVTSLLSVKDSVWVGRTSGDILIVDDTGKLRAVLDTDPMIALDRGPVTNLLYPTSSVPETATPGNVAAIRTTPNGYQVLLWEDWGCMEVTDFEKDLMIE